MTRPGRTPSPTRRTAQRPARQPSRKRRLHHRRIGLVLLTCFGSILVLVLWAVLVRHFEPLGNTNRQNFDAIVVLGTPADSDGNPTPELLDRVTEGVHEYTRGIAPRIIVTGAAAHNRFVEADVMARVAEAQGVPASQIFQEPQALDTIQNACYSVRLMQHHGWHSAEVVSSASHLPRAAMIFSRLPFPAEEWRMHAAPANLTPGYYTSAANLIETIKTARYLLWSRWVETCTS